MSLKLYFDLMSQPSRALYIFLKKNHIQFEQKLVNLGKGEHLQPEFEKINPMKKVPVIEHKGLHLTESVAILRYLCREFRVDDHWYPKDSQAQARVDEYLEWQHLNTRLHCASYFWIKYLLPKMQGEPPKPNKVAQYEERMIECLDQIEKVWLYDKMFLAGYQITIADLLGACEIEQTRIAGFDARDGRPHLAAWLDRVSRETAPYYQEAQVILNKVVDKAKESRSRLYVTMKLELYFDFLSQPSRAVYIFLKTCDIPFKAHAMQIVNGDNTTEEYLKINPFGKVPVITHRGFKLTESVGIVRYLSREFNIPDHWYPNSSIGQARVDEYLAWQHLNTRLHCSRLFLGGVLYPMMRQRPAKPEAVRGFERDVVKSLDAIENRWLNNQPFVAGNEISVADIFAACEIEQTRMASYDPRKNRPKLTDWLERVAQRTSPHYAEAHTYIDNVIAKFAGRPPHTCAIAEMYQ
ncbi:uncharacterized protein LOC131668137 [Phymastichus coffea]|uniref:uncharacterized protein LOC131668137 n=1 Tax=Phymastichus coffea TaxID=108790 RepID=UPI00273AB765|nr:uncharacterized protein LOC131668137 [Phymastichus coffea]